MKLHERFAGQTFQSNDLLLCALMARRKGYDERIGINNVLFKFRFAFRRQGAGESQLNAAVIERHRLLVRIHLIKLQFNVGIFAPVALSQRRQNRRRGPRFVIRQNNARLGAFALTMAADKRAE